MTTSSECACGWTPINESGLMARISEAIAQLTPETSRFWQLVKIPTAEIWQQHPWADEGCGFWVVAIFGRYCIYFNDVTQGFAVSPFRQWGNIDQFDHTPHNLSELLRSLSEPQAAIA
ncbi:hypothetical protein [Oceanobacter mangrovi]|uniref:hypothetical protein n=1 Tax=Oceanobacter mangrovi TaxID=2862510 RepID=UPI001C8EA188|nr:hypothetical protein [Oceanobacter mangrovi]